jgi:putative SOS response-associated peptidase YedK
VCTNFTPTQNTAWVKQHLGVDLPAGCPPESYPGYASPIVVKSHQSQRVACGLARFGLIPSWAKDSKIARHTYNARSETAAEKPSYRTAWRQRYYGLVLVDNFFEPSYATGQAVRWRIGLASSEPFGIACLWDRWTDPATGELVVSFSMLTVNADEHPVMCQFHKSGDEKRTPVIVPTDRYAEWLGADPVKAAEMMSWSCMPELVSEPAPRLAINPAVNPAANPISTS